MFKADITAPDKNTVGMSFADNNRKMKGPLIIFVLLFVLQAGGFVSAETKKDPYEKLVIDQKIAECVSGLLPSANIVGQKALEFARIRPQEISSWKKNVKLAALLPRLQLDYQRRVVNTVAVGLNDSVSVTSQGVSVGPTASDWNQNFDRNNNIEVKAIWYLDELVFNREALSVSAETRALINARTDILSGLMDDYHELGRLVAIYQAPKNEMTHQKGNVLLDINRLVGRLDMHTGGWFSSVFDWREARCAKK